MENDDEGTRLPHIKTASNKDSRGFNGLSGGGTPLENRTNGAISGRRDSMSRHSSRKSIPLRPMQGIRSLNDAKKDRMQVEKDAELLANRIALLKQEEMRTWKKIEETKKRTKDVLEMKKRNEQRLKSKMKNIKDKNKRIKSNRK